MLKDPFPNPRRKKSSGSEKIGGEYFASLKVRDPKMRILVLVGLLILLVLASVMLKSWAASPEANKIADEPSVQTGTDITPRFRGVPALDEQIAERISDQGPDARSRWPLDAATYLLYESQVSPAVRAYARHLIPLNAGSGEQIRADSRPWRFKYVFFRGKLESVREENYEETYGKHPEGEIGQVKRGLVLVDGGGKLDPPLRVTFITDALMEHRDPNELEPKVKAIEDGWVRIRGILVKNFIDETADGEEAPSLLVVATEVKRDYEIVPVRSMKDIDFDIIEDNPAIADTPEGQEILAKNYPQPMFRLVKYAEPRAGAQGAELRKQEGLTPQNIDEKIKYETVIGAPQEFRGEYFGGFGIIAVEGFRFGPSDIPPNDAGVEECFEGWILTDKEKLVRFMAPAPLMDRRWEKRTRIRWGGYFYKSLGYPARDRTRRLAPFVVLTDLEEIKPEPRDVNKELMVAGAFLLGLALLVWIIVRDDKTKKDFRSYRRKQKVEA
ncbi:MAG: hypothetical protein ACYTHK_02425 [Planctomycetota bacterium]|jgi:hypothetical protein